MTRRIPIEELVNSVERIPVADVRTPSEFMQGHIPGAVNIPLFTNEERVAVGTTYKQEGREAAVLLGFDLTGGKWSGFIREAFIVAPDKKIALHCWRGGMRSAAMAWALDLYGFDVRLLDGGYKAYRQWVLRQLEEIYPFRIVGGMTGSGKTRALHGLRGMGEQVVDLEDLAQHHGSTYGTLNRLKQPSQEQFENELATCLRIMDRTRSIWVEDESRSIGRCMLSRSIWEQIHGGPVFDLQAPEERRLELRVEEYGGLDRDWLIECTERIVKRLGTEQTRNAVVAIREGRIADFIRIVMTYYDKMYRKGLDTREACKIIAVPTRSTDGAENARLLMEAAGGAEAERGEEAGPGEGPNKRPDGR
ncbi:MAG: tRNA 2-selenouridine(34) synthase MnmH [Bacteroidota bacterium]|nr:tRNA 2-selenouridine(34) synthase MnmH [Bacteroidota bacterium]